MMALLPRMHRFKLAKLASYATYCSVFPNNRVHNIKITKRYYRAFFISLASTNALGQCNDFAVKQ